MKYQRGKRATDEAAALKDAENASTITNLTTRLDAVQADLTKVSEEKSTLQTRVTELESSAATAAAVAAASSNQEVPTAVVPTSSSDPAELSELKSRIVSLEAEIVRLKGAETAALSQFEAEKKAIETRDQKLQETAKQLEGSQTALVSILVYDLTKIVD